MTKPKIKIGVVSDVVCPWCYIGKRRLEKAMNNVSDKYDFEVEYFPFELNTQMPASGVNQKEYLSGKFGGEARYQQHTAQTTATAATEGLKFDFQAQQVSPNTRKAHRLIQFAKEYNKQLSLVEAFFKAYFSDGIDLSRDENLVHIAVQAGLDKAAVEAFLNSDTGVAEIEVMERELHQLGVTGVPFYIVDNKFGISGAQASETFIQAFEEITAPTGSGEACDVDAKNC
jgi:predicted DsbA family dithiol-disulfide isomerase